MPIAEKITQSKQKGISEKEASRGPKGDRKHAEGGRRRGNHSKQLRRKRAEKTKTKKRFPGTEVGSTVTKHQPKTRPNLSGMSEAKAHDTQIIPTKESVGGGETDCGPPGFKESGKKGAEEAKKPSKCFYKKKKERPPEEQKN